VKINDILLENRSYLYEGLTLTEVRSVKLWETAGNKICEATLTADQIQQLFQQVEQGATAAGGNRTLIGQGKDVATAVNAAWEDLKTKVQNSGPVQNIDAQYDQAAEKLKQATGGDAGVMQYVEKYRKFAKEHPVAQSLIYAALIAAAGISGAGVGGAAALGLLKMTDKLLQGEKFSSAAYAGAKTGAMAYGAGQVGKALQGGDQAQQATQATQQAAGAVRAVGIDAFQNDPTLGPQLQQILSDPRVTAAWRQEFVKQLGHSVANPNDLKSMSRALQQASQVASSFAGNAYGPLNESCYVDRQSTVRMWALKESLNRPRGGMQLTEAGVTKVFSLVEALNKSTGTPNPAPPAAPPAAPADADQAQWTGRKPEAPPAKPDYSGGQKTVTPTIKNNPATASAAAPATATTAAPATATTAAPAPTEPAPTAPAATTAAPSAPATTEPTAPATTAPTEPAAPATAEPATAPATQAVPANKGMLGKAADWVKTKGANLTNKVTADKLNTAWKKAGSPMDSDKLAQVLQDAGVDQQVVAQAYKGLKIPAPGTTNATTGSTDPNYDEVTGAVTPAGQAKKDAEDAKHADRMKNDPKYAAAMKKAGIEPESPAQADPATQTAPATNKKTKATNKAAATTGQPEPDPFTDAGNWLKNAGRGLKDLNVSWIPGTQANLNKINNKANLETAKGHVASWMSGVEANPALNTPQELRKYAQKMAIKDGQKLFTVPLPTDMSRGGVTDYLTNIVARVTSGLETGVSPSNATKSKKAAQAASGAFDQMANQLGGGQQDAQNGEDDDLAGTIPAKVNQANLQKRAQADGVKIKSQEPIIISTGKGKEYGLDDNGQWIHLASGKVPPQSFAKFLDQQHDISLGVGQTAPATNPPTQ